MKVHRTVRYRLHPGSKRKHQQLHGTAGACRFVWNHMVGKLEDEYAFGIRPEWRYYSMGKVFTILRRHSYKWLQGYSANIVKNSLQPIETAYKAFFADLKTGGKLNRKPPRFHGKYTTPLSFPINYVTAKISGDSLFVQKVGWMKMVGNNPYPDGEFKSGRIRHECGNWYAYLVYEVETQASLSHTIREVGVDRNVSDGRWAVLSDGSKHPIPDLGRKVARRKRYQRKLARQAKGSNRRKVTQVRLQKAFQAERFARLNWAHHVSKAIASQYDLTYIEDLNIRSMTKSAKGTVEVPGKNVKAKSELNRRILASAWGMLELRLSYKTKVRKVKPAYSSQTCHQCGHVAKENRPSQSDFKCTACGHTDDADVNAALNILAFGNGATGRGGGDTGGASRHSRPGKRQEMSRNRHADFAT
ncbi:MAG: transposase [Gammaproteobacteria bacterium]|nr:transposase [Gammaproteobacteria bacterium]